MGEIQKGYLYGSVKAGLGLDIAANYPLGQIRGGGPYGTHRSLDGTVVKS